MECLDPNDLGYSSSLTQNITNNYSFTNFECNLNDSSSFNIMKPDSSRYMAPFLPPMPDPNETNPVKFNHSLDNNQPIDMSNLPIQNDDLWISSLTTLGGDEPALCATTMAPGSTALQESLAPTLGPPMQVQQHQAYGNTYICNGQPTPPPYSEIDNPTAQSISPSLISDPKAATLPAKMENSTNDHQFQPFAGINTNLTSAPAPAPAPVVESSVQSARAPRRRQGGSRVTKKPPNSCTSSMQYSVSSQCSSSSRRRLTEAHNSMRDRFLERNRQAASKCRWKKKQQVEELKKRYDELEKQKEFLTKEASSLRNQLLFFKNQLLTHVKCEDPSITMHLSRMVSDITQKNNPVFHTV